MLKSQTLKPFALFLQDEGFKNAKLVIQDLRSKGFCTIGATGICWGGKFIHLASFFFCYGSLFHVVTS